MYRIIAAAVLLTLSGAAFAQEKQTEAGQPPQRIRSVTLQDGDKCPPSTDDEIVVCSTLSGGEQYRIPKRLRQKPPTIAQQSWVNRAAVIDDVARKASGMPDSCSTVGTGGQTGCTAEFIRKSYEERKAAKAEGAAIP